MSSCVSSFYVDLKKEMDRMFKMLHYFHPEITEEIYTKEEFQKMEQPNRSYVYPSIGKELAKKYRTVSHIDADVFVVGRLDNFFDDSSDVRAGRNNSDGNWAGPTRGFELPDIDWTVYVNAGNHSVTGQEFWEDWYKQCVDRGHTVPYGEQGILNQLFHSGNYKSVLLDPIDTNIHFATSFQEGSRTYWDSWKKIVVVDDHLEINGKRIQMMHIAGGSGRKPEPSELFTKDVADFVYNIINS